MRCGIELVLVLAPERVYKKQIQRQCVELTCGRRRVWRDAMVPAGQLRCMRGKGEGGDKRWIFGSFAILKGTMHALLLELLAQLSPTLMYHAFTAEYGPSTPIFTSIYSTYRYQSPHGVDPRLPIWVISGRCAKTTSGGNGTILARCCSLLDGRWHGRDGNGCTYVG